MKQDLKPNNIFYLGGQKLAVSFSDDLNKPKFEIAGILFDSMIFNFIIDTETGLILINLLQPMIIPLK